MMAAGAQEQQQQPHQQQQQQQLMQAQPAAAHAVQDDAQWETTEFKMYQFKVAPCRKPFNHDWTACPYSHIGERACRRDPMRYNYASITCLDMLQKGKCARGDACASAHSLFEYWLHPDRYRTEMCKVGPGCTRRICFFAHNEQELRPLPAHLAAADAQEGGKYSLSAALPRGSGSGGGSSGADGSPTRLAGSAARGSPRRLQGPTAALVASPLSNSSRSGATQQQAAGLVVEVLSAPQEPLRAASSSCSSMGPAGSISISTSTNSPLHANSSWQWNMEAHSGGLQVLHAASTGMCGPLQQHQQQFAPQQVMQLSPSLPMLLPGGQLAAAAGGGWVGGSMAPACPLVPAPTAVALQQQQQQQWLMAQQMQQQQPYQGIPVCAGLAMHLRQLGDALGAGSLAMPGAVMQQPQLVQMMPGQSLGGSCGPGLHTQQQWMLQGQPGLPPSVVYSGADHTGQQLQGPPMLHQAAPGIPAVTSWL